MRSYREIAEERSSAGTKVPVQVNVELTQACNLNCRHCYIDNRAGRDELPTASWKSIIDQIAGMGTMFVAFTGGEIFTRKDLVEICSHAQARGVFYHLQTNGTLIDAVAADAIKSLNPTKVEISLYGSGADLHDGITRVEGSFERSIAAVRLLRERSIRVVIKTTVMNINWRDVPVMEQLALSLGAGYACDPIVMPGIYGSRQQNQLRMSDEDFKSFMVMRGWDKGTDQPPVMDEDFEATDLYRHVVCSAGRSRCAISSRGEVLPCVLWRLSVGNVERDSLETLWRSGLFESLRNLSLNDLNNCRSCSTINTCVRCAAIAYMETGDHTTKASESCRMSSLLKGVRESAGKETVQRTKHQDI